VRLPEPAPGVLPAEVDQGSAELGREEEIAEELGVLGAGATVEELCEEGRPSRPPNG
jgi:hypothetical protein